MSLKKSQNSTTNHQNYLEDAFLLFDKDKDGLISVSELQQVMKSLDLIASKL